jgi:hypothetical protein
MEIDIDGHAVFIVGVNTLTAPEIVAIADFTHHTSTPTRSQSASCPESSGGTDLSGESASKPARNSQPADRTHASSSRSTEDMPLREFGKYVTISSNRCLKYNLHDFEIFFCRKQGQALSCYLPSNKVKMFQSLGVADRDTANW